MKKHTHVILASIAFLAIASKSFAKTEGNYIGLDLSRSLVDHRYYSDDRRVTNYPEFDDSAIGYGVKYKYAFNYDNVFIAPEIFFDKIGSKSNDKDGDSVSVNNRYGAKLNIGYDIADNFALYLTGGGANVQYKVDWKSTGEKKTDNKVTYIAGFGASFYPHKNLALNFEYNYQALDLDTPHSIGINKVKTSISVAKIGIAYHF